MTIKTNLSILDRIVNFDPPSLHLILGASEAVDGIAMGLVMSAKHVQWARFSKREFFPPRADGVEVFDWNAPDRNATDPPPESLVVLDGIDTISPRMKWANSLKGMVEFAKGETSTTVGLVISDDPTHLEADGYLPEDMLKEWRKSGIYRNEIVLAIRHMTDVVARVSRYEAGSLAHQEDVELGSIVALQDTVVEVVSSNVEDAQKALKKIP